MDALPQDQSSDAQRADTEYDLRLYNSLGNMELQKKVKSGTVQFNVANLPDGIYYLHIHDGVSATPEMHQIVVEH